MNSLRPSAETIARFEKPERNAWILWASDKLRYKEIANKIGLTESGVKQVVLKMRKLNK